MAQKPSGRPQLPPSEVLGSINAGLDVYSDPTTTNYKKWYSSNNVFSGPFNFVQRARFANVIMPSTSTVNIVAPVTGVTYIAYTLAPGLALVTVTTTTNHLFSAGQTVIIAGVTQANYNGTWVINSITSPTSFTYFMPYPGFIPASGNGTAAAGYSAQGFPFTTLRYYALPGQSSYVIADANGKLFSFDTGANYTETQRVNPYVDRFGQGTSLLNGPWSRETLQNILYEMNGQVKQTGRGANAAIVEGWGLDAPDATPQIILSSGSSQTITNIQRTNGTVTVNLGGALTVPGGDGIGMVNVTVTSGDTTFAGTFVELTGSGGSTLTWAQLGQNTALLTPTGTVDVNITKSVGRSYAYAWENANKPHVGAPSPSSQFVLYSAQNGVIQCIEQGTLNFSTGTTVTGAGTAFSQAWVGRYLWANGTATEGPIVAVAGPTSLTLLAAATIGANSKFQVYDPQATHIRLYETADGGATYFRTQRNAFSPTVNTLIGSGLQFFDNGNSEPPNFPFTTETSQLNNVPPPVGAYVAEYQGRLVVFGVPGAKQSFFYSNSELTSVGLLQESFAPLNQYTLPIQNAQLFGWIEMPGAAIIWSDRQDMYRLTGLLTDNTAASAPQLGAQISRLPYNLGCANPFAVDLTPLGAVWVTPQAEVWLFTNTYAPRNIGRPIQGILNTISSNQLANVRVKYYHNDTRNWLVIACPINSSATNNTLLILDLDLLASNGSPSFFVFDMATNQPTWYQYTNIGCNSIEVIYEPNNNIRLLVGSTDLIQDADYSPAHSAFGIETTVLNAFVLTHPWGNDSAPMIKRPTFMRFHTNRDPSVLASDGWSFQAFGIDDDFYTLGSPLSLTMTPGVNDTSALSGNPALVFGSPFRHSPELFRIGSVNFVMGRRIQFRVNFPIGTGAVYQFRQVQIGFAPSPPR
jgi:hypothetical protein